LRVLVLNTPIYPGTKANFVGDMPPEMAASVRSAFETSDAFTHTLIANHFCAGFISSLNFRTFASQVGLDGSAYTAHLCGHRHTPNMHGRKGDRHIELEVADMKTRSWTRIAAVDNGVFTIADSLLGTWPTVLVTNPKDARFMTENDPLALMQNSTHIRALVYHNETIAEVSAVVDDQVLCKSMMRADNDTDLFVCPWDAKKYTTGFHTIRIDVTDGNGIVHVGTTQQFALDGSTISIHGLPAIEIKMDVMQWILSLFVLAVFIALGHSLILPHLVSFLLSVVFVPRGLYIPLSPLPLPQQ